MFNKIRYKVDLLKSLIDIARKNYNRKNDLKIIKANGGDVFDGVRFHNTKLGYGSYIANNSQVSNCCIGRYSSIGPNCIIGFGKHPSDFFTSSPIIYKNILPVKKIIDERYKNLYDIVNIEDDVWIGSNVFINNGVRIGRGSIIGAGSIVLKDVGKYEIYVGNPAKKLRDRFDTSIIKVLEKSQWWEYDLDDLEKKINYPNNEFDELKSVFNFF